MIVRGPRPQGNFYVLDKTISEDERLSWAARGLLVYLLGKPDHWRVSPSALVNETASTARPTGRDGVYGLLQELMTAGYLRRSQARGPGGELGSVTYTVSETPLPPEPDTVAPHTAPPYPAEPTQVSIEGKQELKEEGETRAPAKVTFDWQTGAFTGLADEHFDRWRKAFPAVDVRASVLRAAAWLAANPANRKSNYLRFLTNWLTREQDRAPPQRSTTGADHARQHPARTTLERRAETARRFASLLDEGAAHGRPADQPDDGVAWRPVH